MHLVVPGCLLLWVAGFELGLVWGLSLQRLEEAAQNRLRSASVFGFSSPIWFCLLVCNTDLCGLGVSDSQSWKGQQGRVCSSSLDIPLVALREIHLLTGLETLSRCDVPSVTNCSFLTIDFTWFLIKPWDAYWNVKRNVFSAEFLLTYRENPYEDSFDCIFNRLTNYLLIG